jgi:hypothetical protein
MTTLPEKATIALCVAGTLLILGVIGAYWWANTVPSRPRGVPTTAVFLWAPYVGLPGPRRGSWLACSEKAGHNRCTLSGVDGNIEYEGEFVPYGRKDAIPADQLRIDPIKTREYEVWVGEALVPLVYLDNGVVLLPASNYKEATRLPEQFKPNH